MNQSLSVNGTVHSELTYRKMFADLERPSDFQRMARVAGCPVGDYAFGGFADHRRPETLGLNKNTSESPVWRTIVEKAKRDSRIHSQRIAALAGEAECWISVAGIWFSALVNGVIGEVATLVTTCGSSHVVPIGEIAFECPCRWPV